MMLRRVSDDKSVSVALPKELIFIKPQYTRGKKSGKLMYVDGVLEKSSSPDGMVKAIQQYAMLNGFKAPTEEEIDKLIKSGSKKAPVKEATQRVKAYARVRGGKKEFVKQHEREHENIPHHLRPAKRAYDGKQILTDRRLSKDMIGKIGETVALRLKGGMHANKYLMIKRNNLAFDIINVRKGILYEVKAGVISNDSDTQKWRLTKGEPGVEEKEFLRNASPMIKRLHNAGKEGAIMARKLAFKARIEKLTGKKFRMRTIGLILNPDTNTADVHEFNGLHMIIRWYWPMAKKGYARSVKWK